MILIPDQPSGSYALKGVVPHFKQRTSKGEAGNKPLVDPRSGDHIDPAESGSHTGGNQRQNTQRLNETCACLMASVRKSPGPRQVRRTRDYDAVSSQ
jgi:hypothetical protein